MAKLSRCRLIAIGCNSGPPGSAIRFGMRKEMALGAAGAPRRCFGRAKRRRCEEVPPHAGVSHCLAATAAPAGNCPVAGKHAMPTAYQIVRALWWVGIAKVIGLGLLTALAVSGDATQKSALAQSQQANESAPSKLTTLKQTWQQSHTDRRAQSPLRPGDG
jgi:hypothetical protein